MPAKKYTVQINSVENIRELLQETIRLADEQLVQAQREINKLSNSTKLQEEPMDSKTKYAKAIEGYLNVKDRAISKKMEVGRLLTEIYKHNGSIEGTLGDANAMKNVSFDFSKIREMVNEAQEEKEKKETINLNKDINK